MGLETFNNVGEDLLEPVLDLHQEDLKRNRDEIKSLPPTQLGSSQRVSRHTANLQCLFQFSFYRAFFVAYARQYNHLCPSVHLLVCPTFFFRVWWLLHYYYCRMHGKPLWTAVHSGFLGFQFLPPPRSGH